MLLFWPCPRISHREEASPTQNPTIWRTGGLWKQGLTATVIDTITKALNHVPVEHKEDHKAPKKPKQSSTLPQTYSRYMRHKADRLVNTEHTDIHLAEAVVYVSMYVYVCVYILICWSVMSVMAPLSLHFTDK